MSPGTDWMDRALCVGADPDVWFTAKGRDEAQRICAACPVTEQCAAAWPGAPGVWGAESRVPSTPGPSPTIEYLGMHHGTQSGYVQHKRRNEPACDACERGHALSCAEWRERRAVVA